MYKGKFKLEGPEGQKVNEAASAVSRRLADALREAYAEANGKELTPEQLGVRAALAQSCVHGYAALGLDGARLRPEAPQPAALIEHLAPHFSAREIAVFVGCVALASGGQAVLPRLYRGNLMDESFRWRLLALQGQSQRRSRVHNASTRPAKLDTSHRAPIVLSDIIPLR